MIKIKNWDKFQHFKDRRPPWIKLYRDLLDDKRWFDLKGEDAKTLVMLWLIASENGGSLNDLEDLCFRLRKSEKDLKSSIKRLNHWLEHDDINVISERYQDDGTETEKETESNKEKETESLILEIANFYKKEINSKLIATGIKNLKSLHKKSKIPLEALFKRVKHYKFEVDRDRIEFRYQMSNFFGKAEYHINYLEKPTSAPQSSEEPDQATLETRAMMKREDKKMAEEKKKRERLRGD